MYFYFHINKVPVSIIFLHFFIHYKFHLSPLGYTPRHGDLQCVRQTCRIHFLQISNAFAEHAEYIFSKSPMRSPNTFLQNRRTRFLQIAKYVLSKSPKTFLLECRRRHPSPKSTSYSRWDQSTARSLLFRICSCSVVDNRSICYASKSRQKTGFVYRRLPWDCLV